MNMRYQLLNMKRNGTWWSAIVTDLTKKISWNNAKARNVVWCIAPSQVEDLRVLKHISHDGDVVHDQFCLPALALMNLTLQQVAMQRGRCRCVTHDHSSSIDESVVGDDDVVGLVDIDAAVVAVRHDIVCRQADGVLGVAALVAATFFVGGTTTK